MKNSLFYPTNDRAALYLSYGLPAYLAMSVVSIATLRKHNLTIPVILTITGEKLDSKQANKLARISNALNFEVHQRNPIQHRHIRKDYFQLNKALLTRIPYKSVLILDSDTFIFDNVEKLFETYSSKDVYAVEYKRMYKKRGWKRSYFGGVKPLNSGVTLWNHNSAKYWAIQEYCVLLTQQRLPESELLFSLSKNGYHMEEFSLPLSIWKNELEYGLFKNSHVRMPPPFSLKKHTPIIFHTFSQNWPDYYAAVFDTNNFSENYIFDRVLAGDF